MGEEKDFVQIAIKDLTIPNVVARALQQATDRVFSLQTLTQLRDAGCGVSCYIYPDPFGPALGSVNLFQGAPQHGQAVAGFAVSIKLPTHHGAGGVYIPGSVINSLSLRRMGAREGQPFTFNWRTRVARVDFQQSLSAIQEPRILVGQR